MSALDTKKNSQNKVLESLQNRYKSDSGLPDVIPAAPTVPQGATRCHTDTKRAKMDAQGVPWNNYGSRKKHFSKKLELKPTFKKKTILRTSKEITQSRKQAEQPQRREL